MNSSLLRSAAICLLATPSVTQIELVEDLIPGSLSSNPSAMIEYRGVLYFLARPGSSVALYSYSDQQGVTPIRLMSSTGFGQPGQLIKGWDWDAGHNGADTMHFTIGFSDRSELWLSDGTPGGTELWDTRGAHDQLTRTFDSEVVFTDSPVAGSGLWHARGKNLVEKVNGFRGAEIATGIPNYEWPVNPTISHLTKLGSARVLMVGNVKNNATGKTARDLVSFLGGFAGSEVSVMGDGLNDRWPLDLTVFKHDVYFSALDENGKRELWVTGGDDPRLFKDLRDLTPNNHPNPRGSSPRHFTVVGDKMFFWADLPYLTEDQQIGMRMELFVTDGTDAGTKRIGPVIPAGALPAQTGSRVGDLFLFSMRTPGEGIEFWVSDGTLDGTRLVYDIHPTGSSRPLWPLPVGSRHTWFTAHDGIHGIELWWTDGVLTQMVQDRYPGIASFNPEYLTHYDGKIYMSGKTQEHGRELFALDAGAVSAPLGFGSGEGGFEPSLRSEDPVLGSTIDITAGDVPPGSNVAAFLGFPGEPLALLPDGLVYFDLTKPVAHVGGWVMDQATQHDHSLLIPSLPALLGKTFRIQVGGVAPDGSFVLTNAVDLHVGR